MARVRFEHMQIGSALALPYEYIYWEGAGALKNLAASELDFSFYYLVKFSQVLWHKNKNIQLMFPNLLERYEMEMITCIKKI